MEAEHGYLLSALQRLREVDTVNNKNIETELFPTLEGHYEGYKEIKVRLGRSKWT
jgi:hypothetical protein